MYIYMYTYIYIHLYTHSHLASSLIGHPADLSLRLEGNKAFIEILARCDDSFNCVL